MTCNMRTCISLLVTLETFSLPFVHRHISHQRRKPTYMCKSVIATCFLAFKIPWAKFRATCPLRLHFLHMNALLIQENIHVRYNNVTILTPMVLLEQCQNTNIETKLNLTAERCTVLQFARARARTHTRARTHARAHTQLYKHFLVVL